MTNGFYRGLLAILFGGLITPHSGLPLPLLLATAAVVALVTDRFLELCVNVRGILVELQKKNRPDQS